MADELNIYTGQLRYRDIDFMLVFNGLPQNQETETSKGEK